MAETLAVVLALAAQADEGFTWFDTLGYPDLSGAGAYDHGLRRESHADLLKFAGQVLEAPPATPFLIRLSRQLQ